MRIVGGELRGRALSGPKSQAIRPTSDRARESLFNIMTHSYPGAVDGARVLDVFAGTGALGMEALSRGADFALFLELGAEGRALIRSNIDALGLGGKTKISRRDATRPGPVGAQKPFDLIFADPPYGKSLGTTALIALLDNGWISPNALVVLEESAAAMPPSIDGFQRLDVRQFGESAISFFAAHETRSTFDHSG